MGLPSASALFLVLITSAPTADEPSRLEQTYQPWESEPHVWLTFSELALVELSFWGVNRWPRGVDWADVGPKTWSQNLSEGWEYDGDILRTNFFGHPYHGALFYSSARSNGHDFWTSWVFALAGSAAWEFFAETFRPAFNDWVLTGIGGTNLGEIIYRLSVLVVDNTATGFERILREIAGAAINPVRGLTRLLTGESARVFNNPDDRRPQLLHTTVRLGARGIATDNQFGFREQTYQMLVGVDLVYGDVFDRTYTAPFSSFHLGANVVLYSSGDETFERFTRISAQGVLFGWTPTNDADTKHHFGLQLAYDYIDNPGFELGHTSVRGTWTSKYVLSPLWSATAGASLSAVITGATPNDYFVAPEGRTYDLGPGTSVAASASISARDIATINVGYTTGWIWTMSLPDGSRHHLHYASIEARLHLWRAFALGASAGVYWRESFYDDDPDVRTRIPLANVFLAVTP